MGDGEFLNHNMRTALNKLEVRLELNNKLVAWIRTCVLQGLPNFLSGEELPYDSCYPKYGVKFCQKRPYTAQHSAE